MVPPSHMQLLYAKAAAHSKKCIFVEFPNGMHMDTWLSGGDHYWRTIQQFLEEHVPEKDKKESSQRDKGDFSFPWNLAQSFKDIKIGFLKNYSLISKKKNKGRGTILPIFDWKSLASVLDFTSSLFCTKYSFVMAWHCILKLGHCPQTLESVCHFFKLQIL